MASFFLISYKPKLKSKYSPIQRPTLFIKFGKKKSGNINWPKTTMADVDDISE